MPPKRSSTDANLENQLPPISDLLKNHPLSPARGAKRARTENHISPLADISNHAGHFPWYGSSASSTDKALRFNNDGKPLKSSIPPQQPSKSVSPTLPSPTLQSLQKIQKAAGELRSKCLTSLANLEMRPELAVHQSRGNSPVIVNVPTLPTVPKKTPAPRAAKPKNTSASAKPNKPGITDISEIHLEGEATDSVPIFDTCDVVRRKINHAISSTPHTKASLLRAMASCTSMPEKPIPATSFIHFMNAKGNVGGMQSRVFYAGYVYFEKVRIAEGKEKTKTREEMEKAWGKKGMDRNTGKPMWVGPDEEIWMDDYGREFSSRHGRIL